MVYASLDAVFQKLIRVDDCRLTALFHTFSEGLGLERLESGGSVVLNARGILVGVEGVSGGRRSQTGYVGGLCCMEEDWRFEMGGRRLLGHSILVVAILLVVGPGLETCSKWGRQAAGMGGGHPAVDPGAAWSTGAGHDRLSGMTGSHLPSDAIESERTFELLNGCSKRHRCELEDRIRHFQTTVNLSLRACQLREWFSFFFGRSKRHFEPS